MLDAIGESPVSSLNSGLADANLALRKLNEVSRDVQAKGWDCNSEYEFSLSKDLNGYIYLPNNVLKIDSSGVDKKTRVAQRGNRLYDLDNNTFVFTKNLVVDYVAELDYEDLPYAIRYYILCRAGRLFQENAMGSVALDKFTERKEKEALDAWLDAQSDTDDSNVLTSSSSANSIAYRNNKLWKS